MSGKLIVLEGLNGCGKSSTAGHLFTLIQEAGLKVHLYVDPGDTQLGMVIRQIVKDPAIKMDPMSQMLMYCAARNELGLKIDPLLEAGEHVILDRWWPSTFAYQGAGGVDEHLIMDLTRWVTTERCATKRDLTFFLDVDVDMAWERSGAQQPGQGIEAGSDRFEIQGKDFLRSVRIKYLRLVQMGHLRQVHTSAHESPKVVAQWLWDKCVKSELSL